jgi:hypothetical protein
MHGQCSQRTRAPQPYDHLMQALEAQLRRQQDDV